MTEITSGFLFVDESAQKISLVVFFVAEWTAV